MAEEKDFEKWLQDATVQDVRDWYGRGLTGNSRDIKNTTLIMKAGEFGRADIIEVLVDEFDGNVHDGFDYALRYAAKNKHYDAARALVQRGANVDENNGAAMKSAEANNDKKMIGILAEGKSTVA